MGCKSGDPDMSGGAVTAFFLEIECVLANLEPPKSPRPFYNGISLRIKDFFFYTV